MFIQRCRYLIYVSFAALSMIEFQSIAAIMRRVRYWACLKRNVGNRASVCLLCPYSSKMSPPSYKLCPRKGACNTFLPKGQTPTPRIPYFEKVANLMCDVRSVPINISKLFSKISRVHSYSTRSLPSEHFYTKQSALNIQGKDFSRVGVYNWNEIPINLRSLPKNPFKISIKENYSKFNYSRS